MQVTKYETEHIIRSKIMYFIIIAKASMAISCIIRLTTLFSYEHHFLRNHLRLDLVFLKHRNMIQSR